MPNNLEKRVAELEKEIATLRRALKVSSDRIEILTPVYFRYPITVMGATILAGSVNPQNRITASVGALFLRRNGSADNVLFIKESGTGNTGWSVTT